jgi:hypothetical protein
MKENQNAAGATTTETAVAYIERPAAFDDKEALKACVARLNGEVPVDQFGNVIVNLQLDGGLLLKAINVRPFIPREPQNGKTALRAFVTLLFGENGKFVSRGWRFMENVEGERKGTFFLSSASQKLNNGEYNEYNGMMEKGMAQYVCAFVEKLYPACKAWREASALSQMKL